MKSIIQEEVSVLSNEINRRNLEISELQEKIKNLISENKFDESVLKVRKEQLNKIK